MRLESRKFVALSAFIVVLLCLLNTLDLPIELRFETERRNYEFVMLLSVALPLASSILAYLYVPLRPRLLGALLTTPLLIPCGIVLFVANAGREDIIEFGYDPSFEVLHELEVEGASFRLYRTNGGATTSFGLVLREERRLLEGLKIIRTRYSKYKAYDGFLELRGQNSLRLVIQPYGDGESEEVFQFKV